MKIKVVCTTTYIDSSRDISMIVISLKNLAKVMLLKKQIWSLYSAVEICQWNESIDFGFKFESIFWSFLLKWISVLHSVFIGSLQMKHADLTETPQEGHKSNNIIYQCFLLLCLFKLYLWLNEISHIWHIKSEFFSVELEILPSSAKSPD